MFKKLKKFFDGAYGYNTMYNRLYNLYWYCKLFDLNSSKLQVLYKDIDKRNLKDVIELQFKSNLGTVNIELQKCFDLNCGHYVLNYANYAGSTVFAIYSYIHENEVEPQLGFNLKAHDIDLAIFELERYLFEMFGDIDQARERYKIKQENAKKLHEQELKKLL